MQALKAEFHSGEETNRYCVIINSLQGIGGGERGQEPVEISILTEELLSLPLPSPPLCACVHMCAGARVCRCTYVHPRLEARGQPWLRGFSDAFHFKKKNKTLA